MKPPTNHRQVPVPRSRTDVPLSVPLPQRHSDRSKSDAMPLLIGIVLFVLLVLLFLLFAIRGGTGGSTGGSGSGQQNSTGTGDGAGTADNSTNGAGLGSEDSAADGADGADDTPADGTATGGDENLPATQSGATEPSDQAGSGAAETTPNDEPASGADTDANPDVIQNPDSADSMIEEGDNNDLLVDIERKTTAASGGGIAGIYSDEDAPGETTVSFFQTQGIGNSFTFVIDRSGSMGGKPFEMARAELLHAIGTLNAAQMFSVVYFDDEPLVCQLPESYGTEKIKGTKENLRIMTNEIQQIQVRGGTEHFKALTKSLTLKSDILFYLTDGEQEPLSDSELEKIRQKADKTTKINVIHIGASNTAPRDHFLRQLATDNRGDYRYIPHSQVVQP